MRFGVYLPIPAVRPAAVAGRRVEQIAEVYERIPLRRLVLGLAGAGKSVLAGRVVLNC